MVEDFAGNMQDTYNTIEEVNKHVTLTLTLILTLTLTLTLILILTKTKTKTKTKTLTSISTRRWARFASISAWTSECSKQWLAVTA